jgi:hypothetical protein
MSSELRNYVARIRNTRTFSFDSACGDTGNGINAKLGNFDMLVEGRPFPQNVFGSRALFKLISYHIVEETATERASGSIDVDTSLFFIQISGLGLENSLSTTSRVCGPNGRANHFTIINKFGQADNQNSFNYQRVSGGEYEGPEILCSNPIGTLLNVRVFDIGGDEIVDNTDLNAIIQFSIEMIPDEISSNI